MAKSEVMYHLVSEGVDSQESQPIAVGRWSKVGVALLRVSGLMLLVAVVIFSADPTFKGTSAVEPTSLATLPSFMSAPTRQKLQPSVGASP